MADIVIHVPFITTIAGYEIQAGWKINKSAELAITTSSLEKPKAIDYKLKWIEYAQLVNHRRIEYGND